MVATVLTTWIEEGFIQLDWTGPLANTEAGAIGTCGRWATKSVHAAGTFGAAGAVTMEGSNDGTNWGPLKNGAGVAAVLIAATPIMDILENTKFIRPRVTAGDGTTALRVILVGC